MAEVELKPHKVAYAKRLYEILNNPNFVYFSVCPKTVKEEEKWLKDLPKKMKSNFEYSYAIFYKGKLVGSCGIKVDQHRKHIGEMGYFIDEDYWGKGITTKAVKLLEKIGFGKLKLKRLTIIMDPKNKSSEKVAIKCGYKREGTMKKAYYGKNKYFDAHLYAKVI